jgi:hypothetical protein
MTDTEAMIGVVIWALAIVMIVRFFAIGAGPGES